MYKPTFCRMCENELNHFDDARNRNYLYCDVCHSIQLNVKDFISSDQEFARYKTHHNDVNDIRYQNFVMPLVNKITSLAEKNSIGLDFGAGSGPVITKLLNDLGYQLDLYDPYFHPHLEIFSKTYDYIVSCEVIEHFNYPKKDFDILYSLLKSGGHLILKTNLYNKTIDFQKWWYKNDETHVIFYTKETFEYIKDKYNFQTLEITDDYIYLKK